MTTQRTAGTGNLHLVDPTGPATAVQAWRLTVAQCATGVDTVASEVERVADGVETALGHLGRGDLLAVHVALLGVQASVRPLAGRLGKIHAELDELAPSCPRPPAHGGGR
jgi:hypothetical protein